MKLDADPTVIYPVTKGKPLGRRILRSELHSSDPYNTYTHSGLPPGPIANPGKASIEAVFPPETKMTSWASRCARRSAIVRAKSFTCETSARFSSRS